MARKITQGACEAFFARKNFSKSNTTVVVEEGPCARTLAIMNLHGNPVAMIASGNLRLPRGTICIRTAGYATTTTKERLNGLFPVSMVYTKKHVLHLGTKPWEDHENWTDVCTVEALQVAKQAISDEKYNLVSNIFATSLNSPDALKVAHDAMLEGNYDVAEKVLARGAKIPWAMSA